MGSNSFVENINNVSNAINLATGDIVEDTQAARDEAVTAAAAGNTSALNAAASEAMAKGWAEKGHNNPVTGTAGVDAEYSAYHWSIEAGLNVGDPLINDSIISANYTWSSDKLSTQLATKSDTTHDHAGIYETVITKKTAFNKDFGTTVTDVAPGYHVHDGTNGSVNYEPNIGAKSTGFNKDFGTTAGTVAEGNHTHNYEPSFTHNTAFNKDFVVDAEAPTADEIPRGNHTHKATGISLDNSNMTAITSSTVQGGMTDLDAIVGAIDIVAKTYGTLALDGDTSVVPISTADTWVRLTALTKAAGSFKNMSTPSASRLAFAYDNDPANLIEVRFSANITFTVPTSNTKVALTAYKVPLATGTAEAINADWLNDATSTTSTSTTTIALDGYLPGFLNGDAIELWIKNVSNNDDITLHSLTMVLDGTPTGALISSGIIVDHSELTGTSAADSHPISAITSLQTELDGRALSSHTHTVSEVTDFDPATKQDLVVPAASGNVATLDGTGSLTDSGINLSTKAELAGSATQLFSVQDGTTGNEAVNYVQLTTVNTNADSKIPKVSTPTTGNFPQLASDGTLVDSIYDEESFATASHTHAITDVTNLQTTLDNKYVKVTTPVTDNLPSFGAGDVLKDSGIATGDLSLTVDYIKAVGNINNPLLDLPLNNSLSMKQGTGEVTFSRTTTATYVDRYGVLQTAAIDEPRFEKEGLLIEGASTNLILYSEDFSNTEWTKNATVGTDTTLAPDGSSNAYKVDDTASDATQYAYNDSASIADDLSDYTASMFLKKGDQQYCQLELRLQGGTSVTKLVYIDLNNGTLVSGDTTAAKIESLNDSWYRVSITATNNNTGNLTGRLLLRPATLSSSYDDTLTGYTYGWGGQIEKLSFVSSYIATSSAATLKTADDIIVTSNNNFNRDEGSILLDLGELPAVNYNILYKTDSNNFIYGYINDNGQLSIYSPYGSPGTYTIPNWQDGFRVALVWDSSYVKLYIDGVFIQQSASTSSPLELTDSTILIGKSGTWRTEGCLKSFRVYDKALTSTEIGMA